MEIENKIWFDDESLGYMEDERPIEKEYIRTYLDDEVMEGVPTELLRSLQHELATDILNMTSNNYEEVCNNMRMYADVIEILEDYINDKFIRFRYNPMGNWYLDEVEER